MAQEFGMAIHDWNTVFFLQNQQYSLRTETTAIENARMAVSTMRDSEDHPYSSVFIMDTDTLAI
jgi:hypothetical protein